jgi:hypothetical protein
LVRSVVEIAPCAGSQYHARTGNLAHVTWSRTDPISVRSPGGDLYEVRLWPVVAPINVNNDLLDGAVRLWGRLRLRINKRRDVWLVLINKRGEARDVLTGYPRPWKYGPWEYDEALLERDRRVAEIEHGDWSR